MDDRTLQSSWYQTLHARQKDCVVFRNLVSPSCVGTDCGQSISRDVVTSTVDNVPVAPTLLPGSKVWVYPKYRLLAGIDSMTLQGFPVAKHKKMLEDFDHHLFFQLGGNMMSATVVLAIVTSFICSVHWGDAAYRDKEDGSGLVDLTGDDDEVLGALQALKRARHR